jgi:hypothetical protein
MRSSNVVETSVSREKRWGFGQLYGTQRSWTGQFKMLHFLFSFIPNPRLASGRFLEEVDDIIRLNREAVWGLGLL